MDRKKILLLILVLVVLVGGIFLISSSIKDKKQGVTAPNPVVATKEEPVNMFRQGSGEDNGKNMIDISGTVDVIGEKDLTVKTQNEAILVNISGVTPVMVTGADNKAVVGQIADLKVGDVIKVTYDKVTRNAVMVYLNR
jgi:hypothetical protein